jgi:hypothetical protein
MLRHSDIVLVEGFYGLPWLSDLRVSPLGQFTISLQTKGFVPN